MADTFVNGNLVVVADAPPTANGVVTTEESVVVAEAPPTVVVVTVAEAGPPGLTGPRGVKGDPGEYDGAIADASPDPVLLFDNALI